MTLRYRLLSTTFIPLVMGMGVGVAVVGSEAQSASHAAFQIAAADNPCAASACNPCNSCAAACNPCNPCAAACVVPRLVVHKACNPCNPCAASACNPCNPCAASACNPCNPCAASACNPCNPCAAGEPAELTSAEARAAYECVKGSMDAGYAKSKLMSDSGLAIAGQYQGWTAYNTQPYVSDTHGGRFVNNYGNQRAKAYGKYENAGNMPTGSVLVKDSFVVRNGRVLTGPLFVMEKMPAGFNADSGNWRYTLVVPSGKAVGTTNGPGSANVEFCIGCHMAVSDTDSMLFIPSEYRVKN